MGSMVRVAMTSQSSCEGNLERQFCNPNTLQYQLHGLTHGVSSFRWLAGASYFEIEQVHGDNSVWDYTAFNKVGTTWAGLNMAFFVLYDVVLVGHETVLGLQVAQWGFAKYHERRENCEAQAGGGKDSPGIDCSSPAGLLNVGPSFDAKLVGPVYVSTQTHGELEADVQMNCKSYCTSGPSTNSQIFSHQTLGFRVGYNNVYALGVQLQTNSIFANPAIMIPVCLKREFLFVGQVKLMRARAYGRYLSFALVEPFISRTFCLVFFALWSLYFARLVYTGHKKDITNDYTYFT